MAIWIESLTELRGLQSRGELIDGERYFWRDRQTGTIGTAVVRGGRAVVTQGVNPADFNFIPPDEQGSGWGQGPFGQGPYSGDPPEGRPRMRGVEDLRPAAPTEFPIDADSTDAPRFEDEEDDSLPFIDDDEGEPDPASVQVDLHTDGLTIGEGARRELKTAKIARIRRYAPPLIRFIDELMDATKEKRLNDPAINDMLELLKMIRDELNQVISEAEQGRVGKFGKIKSLTKKLGRGALKVGTGVLGFAGMCTVVFLLERVGIDVDQTLEQAITESFSTMRK